MKKFIGLILHMGIIKLPSYQHYWSKKPMFGLQFFRRVMSYKRFQSILRFGHFREHPEYLGDRLSKIRLMIDAFNDICQSILIPDKNLSLDESMMLWRGRLVFRQYIKNKKINMELNSLNLQLSMVLC